MADWVDTHCHLSLSDADPSVLLERARNVAWLVSPGVDAASSAAAEQLSLQFPERVLATAGLHPHSAAAWSSERTAVSAIAMRVAAVGETGLDYYRNLSPRDDQVAAFRAQLDLARDLDKPIVVHCRDAFSDVYDLLDEYQLGARAVLHCWTGGPRWTRRFLDLDATFSFAGPLTFETGDTVRRGAAVVPPERAMVETDTPYLTPPPDRHLPNEPANVAKVGAALAEVWGLEVDEVATLTSARATAVFR